MREPLSTDEIIEMIDAMVNQAQQDAEAAEVIFDDDTEDYWTAYARGLLTLKIHIATGVKASCYPLGSCTCHPVMSREGR